MPIYFSSEDGKYYSKDIPVTGITDGFFNKAKNVVNYVEDIKKITHNNDSSQISKEDRIILFKNDIENYLNKTYKYLNFDGIDEINSIVNSGLTTINGLTNDRYYEALTLSKWKNKVDVFVGDIIDKFASGTTTLSEPKEFLKNNPSFPKIPVVDQLSLDYSRNNLFNNRNYTVFNDGNNSNPRQTSPLIIEEIVRGLTTSLTGIGPIDGQCITNGDPEIIQNDQVNTIIYKFPPNHIFGFQPSDKVINFISNPNLDNMVEAFFGGGTNGLFSHDSGITFPPTGTLGLPIPVISLTGGVVGANGETGNPLASIFVDGLSQGYDVFNLSPPDNLSVPDALRGIFENFDLSDGLKKFNEAYRRMIYSFCRKYLDQGDDNYDLPYLFPKIEPIFDGSATGATFWDQIPGLELIPQLDPRFFTNSPDSMIPHYFPLIVDQIKSIDNPNEILDYLNYLKLITTNSMNSVCTPISCDSVNWYDPVSNPCGVVFWKQCCEKFISTQVEVDFDLKYFGLGFESIIIPILRGLEKCGIVDFGENFGEGVPNGLKYFEQFEGLDPTEIFKKFMEGFPLNPITVELDPVCNECSPPTNYDVSSSPCFQGSSCGLPIQREGEYFSDVIFEHTFMFYINGACIAKIIRGLICGQDLGLGRLFDTIIPGYGGQGISSQERRELEDTLGFDPMVIPSIIQNILGKVEIKVKVRLYGRNVVYYSTAAGCGCDNCPCESAPCVSDENCVETKIPTLYLPNTSV